MWYVGRIVNYRIETSISMVEILCPHCEGEIELDDDASGEFACPLCDGEFEWNIEEEESFDDAVTHTDNRIITTDFNEMPAVPKVAGIAFCIYMGLVIILGLGGIILGLALSSAESAYGSGTSFGLVFVIISLVVIGFAMVGMAFGFKTAKGEYIGLIGITCISGLMFLLSVFGYEDAGDIPSILIALAFTIGNLCCIFVPILKAQFTGVLVSSSGPRTPKKMVNEFDKSKPIHPLEWAGHGVSLVMLIMVIICLSSSSWYSISLDDEDFLTMGLSEVELDYGFGFGLGETVTYSELVEDEEDFYDARCVDGSSAQCDDIKQSLDYWKSWKTSTLILKIILIITLVVAIVGVISRVAAILANTGLMNLPDNGYKINDMIRKFSPIVSSVLLFVGVLIFMIFQPGVGPDEVWGGDEGLDGSFGAIVWIALIFSLLTPILSKFEIDVS